MSGIDDYERLLQDLESSLATECGRLRSELDSVYDQDPTRALATTEALAAVFRKLKTLRERGEVLQTALDALREMERLRSEIRKRVQELGPEYARYRKARGELAGEGDRELQGLFANEIPGFVLDYAALEGEPIGPFRSLDPEAFAEADRYGGVPGGPPSGPAPTAPPVMPASASAPEVPVPVRVPPVVPAAGPAGGPIAEFSRRDAFDAEARGLVGSPPGATVRTAQAPVASPAPGDGPSVGPEAAGLARLLEDELEADGFFDVPEPAQKAPESTAPALRAREPEAPRSSEDLVGEDPMDAMRRMLGSGSPSGTGSPQLGSAASDLLSLMDDDDDDPASQAPIAAAAPATPPPRSTPPLATAAGLGPAGTGVAAGAAAADLLAELDSLDDLGDLGGLDDPFASQPAKSGKPPPPAARMDTPTKDPLDDF